MATSSGASALRDEALAQARVIREAQATDLPVSADPEKGFGDTPEFVAETERR
jgi:2-methylisocitrate lyase-like PEP mutase family enzyme